MDVHVDLPTFGSEDDGVGGGEARGQTRGTAEFAPEDFNRQSEGQQQDGIYIERNKDSTGPVEVVAEDADLEPCLLYTQYKEDTKQHLLKCLDEDISFSKI